MVLSSPLPLPITVVIPLYSAVVAAAKTACAKQDIIVAPLAVAQEGIEQMKNLFHVQKLPVVLLLDSDNQELGRIEENLSSDALPPLLKKLEFSHGR